MTIQTTQKKFIEFLDALETVLHSDAGKAAINAALKASYDLRQELASRNSIQPAPLKQIADAPSPAPAQ